MSGISSAEKIELLKMWKGTIEKLSGVIDSILEGSSEDAACKKYGVSKSLFRSIVFRKGLSDSKHDELREKLKGKRLILTPAERLWCDIMGYDIANYRGIPYIDHPVTDDYVEFPPDLDETIPELIKRLPDRYQMLINERYFEGKTLEEIGKKLGVTRGRAGDIEKRALKMLCSKRRYCVVGKELFEYDRKTKLECMEDYRRQIKEEIDKRNEEMKNRPKADKILDMEIEDLELSVRSYNCLKRAGLNTVGDILKVKSFEEMIKIRNLGRRSIKEIDDKLKEIGTELPFEID